MRSLAASAWSLSMWKYYVKHFVRNSGDSSGIALELPQSCTKQLNELLPQTENEVKNRSFSSRCQEKPMLLKHTFYPIFYCLGMLNLMLFLHLQFWKQYKTWLFQGVMMTNLIHKSMNFKTNFFYTCLKVMQRKHTVSYKRIRLHFRREKTPGVKFQSTSG